MKKLLDFAAVCAVVCTVMVIVFMPSCVMSPGGITILDGDYTPPRYIEAEFPSSSSVILYFSEKIEKIDAELCNDTTKEVSECLIRSCENEAEEGGRFPVAVDFSTQTQCGYPYTLYACAGDERGNTLTFSFSFPGYNDRIPKIILNEVRTEYTKPKVEFIELRVIEDGNIGGLVLYNANDGEDKKYIFPPVEVKKDEFIVLHYRKIEENCIDELSSLDESSGTDASSSARDFWVQDTSARIGSSDVILLKSSCSGSIIDALLFSESGKENWKTAEMEEAAQKAYECGAWSTGFSVQDALCSDYVTTTRTLSRQNDGSWITTASGGASPGRENSVKSYIQ